MQPDKGTVWRPTLRELSFAFILVIKAAPQLTQDPTEVCDLKSANFVHDGQCKKTHFGIQMMYTLRTKGRTV